jgi:hypothetical protein
MPWQPLNRSSLPLFPEMPLVPGFDTINAFRPFISGSLAFAFTDLI